MNSPILMVFADANVLFSAAYSDHIRAALLFRLASACRCEVITSAHAVMEAERNIARKLPRAKDRLDKLVRQIRLVADQDEWH